MRKIYIIIIIALLLFSKTYASRFQSKTFVFARTLNYNNFSIFFNYKQELKSSFFNADFIFGNVDSELVSKFEDNFLLTLFDIDFMLYNKNSLVSKKLITNYTDKFGSTDNIINYSKYELAEDVNFYILFLSDKVDKSTRLYNYNENIEALRLFFSSTPEVSSGKNKVILLLDVSYFDFRNICEKIDFIDYIINFQNYDSGIINNKKIYNLPFSEHFVLRADFLSGKTGFLSASFSEVNLEDAPQSQFINRILATND